MYVVDAVVTGYDDPDPVIHASSSPGNPHSATRVRLVVGSVNEYTSIFA